MILSLLVPAAAAGGANVEATYLEDNPEECDHHYDDGDYEYEYSDPNYSYHYQQYWMTYSESCGSDFTTASVVASSDDETVASASVGGGSYTDTENRYSQTSEESTSPYGESHGAREDWAYSQEEGWSRDVSVTAADASVAATRGCSSSSSSHQWWADSRYRGSYGENESFSHYGWMSNDTYESEHVCRDEVAANHGGHDVVVGRDAGCHDRWTYTYHDGAYYDAWSEEPYYYTEWEERHTNRCWNMADARVDDLGARGGFEDTCTYEDRETSAQNGWNESNAREHEQWSRECFNGVTATGPDGMKVRAGAHDERWGWSHTSGNETESGGHERMDAGAEASWENNPAGPYDVRFYVPVGFPEPPLP